MCCNLCDADLSRPGQLAAAPLGENKGKQSESALAGTLVSSLHRLKDIDNSGTLKIHCCSSGSALIGSQMAASSCFQISPSRSKGRSVSPSASSR